MMPMTPDELEQLIDRFEELLIVQYYELGNKDGKKRAEILASNLGNTNTASLLFRAIDAGVKKKLIAMRHIESARGWIPEMRKQNRVF